MTQRTEHDGASRAVADDDTACRGCGTCCRKGGPTLHVEDMALFASGPFLREHCVTLRRGELAHDEAAGTLAPLTRELVKFSGERPGVWLCRFLRPGERGCGVYAHRPAECRALLCRDTRAIIELSPRERVARADVLRATGASDGWEDLALAHEDACAYELLAGPARALREDPQDTAACEAFLDHVRLDIAYRQLAHERAGVPPAEMDFLFGRPLFVTAVMYGFTVRRGAEGLEVAVTGPSPAGG